MSLKKISLVILPLVAGLACGLITPDSSIGNRALPIGTTVELTATVSATRTPTLDVTKPTAISSSTVTKLYFTFTNNTNCREGPSQAYGVTTVIFEGNAAEVIGRNEKNTWLFVSYAKEKVVCWVSIITGVLDEKKVGTVTESSGIQSTEISKSSEVMLSPIPIMPTLTSRPDWNSNPQQTPGSLHIPPSPTNTYPVHVFTFTPVIPNPLTPSSFPTQVLP